MGRLHLILPILMLAAGLGACADRLPPPDPTIVEVRISADEGINTGTAGDGLPIPVRLYRLSSATAFEEATFDEIYHQEMKTLGGHLVGVTEFVLFPGQAEVITREFNERERHFGIVVAYKGGAPRWRASTSVPPGETSIFNIRLGPRGVALERS